MAIDYRPYERYVQQGLVDGQYTSGEFTMLAAGPPRLANLAGGSNGLGAAALAATPENIVQPVGLVQNLGLSQQGNFNRIFELGSSRSYFIRGRIVGQLQLSRIMYHGPSLLRMLYAYYQDLIPPTLVRPVFENIGAATVANPHDVKVSPGFENLFLNLASDLFGQPVGLMLKVLDSNEDVVGAVYVESAYVPNHSFSTNSSGVITQENASLDYERLVPVAVSALSLIQPVASSILG